MVETNPYQVHVTKNSVLLYQPVKNADFPETGHVLQMPWLGEREHACKVSKDHYFGNGVCSRKITTLSEEMGSAPVNFNRAATEQVLRSNVYDRQLEPGEYVSHSGIIYSL
jgi:hypothetical protein